MKHNHLPLLQLSNLEVTYLSDLSQADTQDFISVQDVSFDIQEGELFALVGESGCGKSTLINAVLRTLNPPGVISGGQCFFLGSDLFQITESKLNQLRWSALSLVPQSAMNALNPVLNIWAQFQDVLEKHDQQDLSLKSSMSSSQIEQPSEQELRTLVVETLELVELSADVLKLYPHELSGGMRQRVTIALALILRPKLIIMDEPTTALDVIVQHEIMQVVLRLRDELGFSILLITHDLPLVLSLADRVGIMQKGKLLKVATPTQLLLEPQIDYIAQLIHASKIPIPKALNSKLTIESALPKHQAKTVTLKAKNLVKIYKQKSFWKSTQKTVLQNVNLELYQGETLALVGASGSGKSTLARLFMQMEQPTSGEIYLGEKRLDPKKVDRAFKTQIQMVFQDPFGALNPIHTIAYHLQRPLLIHQVCTAQQVRAQALALLESVGLSPAHEFIDRYPHALSGGQRQRVCIARALASRPKLLIADEPTSMLDVSLREDLLLLLQQLIQEHQLSLLLITHDLSTAQALADQVAILDQGKIVEQGLTTEVFQNPQHPFTQRLVKAIPQTPNLSASQNLREDQSV